MCPVAALIKTSQLGNIFYYNFMSWNAVGMFEISFFFVCVCFLNVLPPLMDQFCIGFVIPRFVLCREGQKHCHLGRLCYV